MNYSRVKGIEEIISLIKRIPKTPDNEKTLSIPIVEILQLSTRAINILSQAGIKILSDFLLINPEKLCTARNIGDKTICEIREAVEAQLASATNANIKKRFLKKGGICGNYKRLSCSPQDQLFDHTNGYTIAEIDDGINRNLLFFPSSQIDKSILLRSIEGQRPTR